MRADTFDTFLREAPHSTLICCVFQERYGMSSPLLEKVQRQKNWRRRYPRHRVDLPVKLTALRDQGYAEIAGRCSDIGHGGIGAILTGEVPAGEVVSIEFRLPSSTALLTIRAIVRFQRGFTHGLEFLSPSVEVQGIVDSFCAGLEVVD